MTQRIEHKQSEAMSLLLVVLKVLLRDDSTPGAQPLTSLIHVCNSGGDCVCVCVRGSWQNEASVS